MFESALVLLALLGAQDSKNPTKPHDDDDEVVAGLPDGEPSPLPARVRWDVANDSIVRTEARERINASGYWRFAAVDEQDTPVKRSEMGWIDLPGGLTSDGANVFDSRFRGSDGLWRGKPIDKYPLVWLERDIRITNDDTLEWLNRRVFLVIRRPWPDAEIYASQRIPVRPAQGDEANGTVHVHVEPVTAVDRDGELWCDITEQLIYPGTTQISVRLKRSPLTEGSREPAEIHPEIRLERWPTGPRVNSIKLKLDAKRENIEATFALERPRGFILLGSPPVRTLPLSLKVWLEAVDSGKAIVELNQDVRPLEELKRDVVVKIPRSEIKSGDAVLRLRAQLSSAKGTMFDDPFPVEFRLSDLESVGGCVTGQSPE